MANGLWVFPDDLGSDLETSDYAMEACEAASFLLWGMSGRKFSGLFNITERYLLQERPDEERYYLVPGLGLVVPKSINVLSEVRVSKNIVPLRGKPVKSITSITMVSTGDVVDPANYDLWDHSTIRFIGPIPGDIDVEYEYGTLPPTSGQMAARELARQFALLWGGRSDECSLPSRVTNVSRQGVSWVLLDQQDFINELRTGIYSVDLFLKTVNPDGARQRAKVFSPDVPRGRRKSI